MKQATITIDAPMTALILSNAVASVTAWVAGWGLGELFRLYWFELVAVGVVALFQIRTARRPGPFVKSRGYQGIFFVAHYGTFCVAYGATMSAILGARWDVEPVFWLVVWIPVIALCGARAIEFRIDFLRREAAFVSPMQAMVLPYLRVVPVLAPIAIAAAALPESLPATAIAVLLSLGKLAAEAAAYGLRRRAGQGGAA